MDDILCETCQHLKVCRYVTAFVELNEKIKEMDDDSITKDREFKISLSCNNYVNKGLITLKREM